MSGTCIFCGFSGKLTGEHVFGDWLSRIELDRDPVPHGTGWLNRVGRELGVRPPFQQKVRDVCGRCNSGWMSRLEDVAKRVLTPLILGKRGRIEVRDQAAVAMWAQKTALVAMLVSPESERASGYGLPAAEYRALYARREQMEPLPASQFWAGRYDGVRGWSVRVTPLVVAVEGLPEPEWPRAYAMTSVLGQLVVHGVRFTTPALQVEVSTGRDMPQLWPPAGSVRWPRGTVVDDAAFLRFAGGKELCVAEPHVRLRPWKPATDLADSRAVGGMVELPVICGKHAVYYPGVLVSEAMGGRFYAFMTSCECELSYLVLTEPDGVHCKAADTAQAIGALYESLPGEEYLIEDGGGAFVCKRQPSPR
jgi:hypothetical protein